MTATGGYEVLMVEPSAMIRGVIVQVARELHIAQVHQTGNWAMAQRVLGERSVDCLILSMDEPSKAEELVNGVRSGAYLCPTDVPVIALVPAGIAKAGQTVERLGVAASLPVPFRIRDVFSTLGRVLPRLQLDQLQATLR